MELTILGAILAGLVSFLSPCVLPLVPAYLGQLTAVAVAGGGGAVAGRSGPAAPSRWRALAHAAAYVAGFGIVFTLLGITATFAGGPLYDWLPALRVVGGLLVIVLGLSLAGILRIPVLERSWRPLEAGAAASVAATTGTIALSAPGGGAGGRVGAWLVGRGGWLASLGLGAVFAVGWTPCIGAFLGAVLTMAATTGTVIEGTILLVAYSIGLGIPFLLLAFFYDRAPGLIAPLVRRGGAVATVGGLLVVAIGVAMVFDWLSLLPRWFNFAGV